MAAVYDTYIKNYYNNNMTMVLNILLPTRLTYHVPTSSLYSIHHKSPHRYTYYILSMWFYAQ